MARVMVLLALQLVACKHEFPSRPASDARRIDAARDSGVPTDRRLLEARPDAPGDGRRDAPADARRDAPVDARRDSRRDGPRKEAKPPDKPQPDLPAIKCNVVGNSAAQIGGPISKNGKHLIVCEYPSAIGPITQCEAQSACVSPWKLCTVSAYTGALGGAGSTPPAAGWGWLAACARRNGVVLWDPASICDPNCPAGSSALQSFPLMMDCANAPYPPTAPGMYDAGCPPTCVVANNLGLTSYTSTWCFYSPTAPPSGPFAPCPVSGVGGVGGGGKTAHDPRRALCCYP
jgi:hypothetical protein